MFRRWAANRHGRESELRRGESIGFRDLDETLDGSSESGVAGKCERLVFDVLAGTPYRFSRRQYVEEEPDRKQIVLMIDRLSSAAFGAEVAKRFTHRRWGRPILAEDHTAIAEANEHRQLV